MEMNQGNEILILDFDHTLFLSNSTEEYLDSAKPHTLCSLVLAILDWLKVWNLFPGENKRVVYRDAIRIICISILFPWSYLVYRARVPYLLKDHLNSEILEILTLKSWEKVIIASNGFNFILKPLLAQMNIQVDLVLSSQLFLIKNGIRAAGKKSYLEKTLTSDELQKSTFISDNSEDKELLGIVNEFIFYGNHQAKRFRVGQDVYIPFVYTHASKRGNSNHLLNKVILEDYPFIMLAYGFSNPISVQIFIAVFLLVLSFWCIYEAGYFENDLYELKHELKHKNPEKINFIQEKQKYPIEKSAWVWSAILSSFGLFILEANVNGISNSLTYVLGLKILIWLAWLGIARLVFRVYTYSPFLIRVSISPILQLTRLVGPALFLSINFCGAFFIVSRVISRWFSYASYRSGGDLKTISQPLVRHIIFVILIAALAVVQKDITIFLSLQFVLTLAVSVIRGHFRSFIASKHIPE